MRTSRIRRTSGYGRRPRAWSAPTTAAVIEAARMLPDCDFTLTGDPRRCQPDVRARAPRNVGFPGFLRGERYSAALDDADVIVSVTSQPQSVSRASYEAVYALRPLVSSDGPITRELFEGAVHVANDAASIAEGCERRWRATTSSSSAARPRCGASRPA